MKRSEAIALARRIALIAHERDDEDGRGYLPAKETVEFWRPHDWVVDAILEAAQVANRRALIAAGSPVNAEIIARILGTPLNELKLGLNEDRAVFLAIMAAASIEYADALIKQLDNPEG